MPNDGDHHPHLVVTVHGIRTFGQWQERLEALVRGEANAEIEFANYKYGYFSVIAFIVPFFRWLVVRRFRVELIKLCTDARRTRIDLVGHSFGTHIIAWAVAGLPPTVTPPIHTIILSGSVLRAGFPWRDLIKRKTKRVVNDCGTRDAILLLSQFFVLFTGMAGRTGFSGLTGEVFRNRYSVFGHGGYFEDNQGRPSDSYMKENWLPLLICDERIPEFDHREASAIEGLVTALANNSEPIKLCLYAAPFIALSWWIYGLYLNAESQRLEAERQRDLAYTTESRFFADLARQRIDTDAVTAALIAIEGLPDPSSGISRPFVVAAERQLYDAIQSQRETYLLRGPTSARRVQNLGNRRILGTFEDDSVRVWSLTEPRPRLLFSTNPGEATATVSSVDGRRIITVSRDHVARIWDTETGRVIKEIPGVLEHNGFVLSADGRYLATISETASGELWDLATGQHLVTLDGPVGRLESPAFNQDASLIVGVDPAGTSEVWDVRSGAKRISIANNVAVQAFFISNGNRVLVREHGGIIAVFDVQTGKQISLVQTEYHTTDIFAVSQDGTRVVVMGQSFVERQPDRHVEYLLFDTSNTNEPLASIVKYHGYEEDINEHDIKQIAFNTGADRAVVLQQNAEAVLLDRAGKIISSFFSRYASFSRDRKWVVSISAVENVAEVRNAETGELTMAVPLGDLPATSSEIDDNLEFMFTADKDGTIRAWKCGILPKDFKINALVEEGEDGDPNTGISEIQFSPDGQTLAVASPPRWILRPMSFMRSGDVSVWDLRSGIRLASLRREPDQARDITLAYSKDGKRILIKSPEHPPIIWNWQTEPLRQIGSKEPELTADALADLGQSFKSPTQVGPGVTVRLDSDGPVALDAGGRRLPMGTWKPADEIEMTVVSPDGQRLAVADRSTSVAILRLFGSSTLLMELAKIAMPRCLTPQQRKRYRMGPIPPRWCITGPGREGEQDSAKWSGVWPYDTNIFRSWLVAADSARSRGASRWEAISTRLAGGPSPIVLPTFPVDQAGQ